jgi:hypothetical protein
VGVRDLSIWHSNWFIGEHPGSRDPRPPGGISGRWSRMRWRWGPGRFPVGWQHMHEPLHLMLSSVRPIENFSGHSIKPYRNHGGKSLLLVRNRDPTKMEEGGYFAIETFGSTGRGLAFGFVRGHISTLSAQRRLMHRTHPFGRSQLNFWFYVAALLTGENFD